MTDVTVDLDILLRGLNGDLGSVTLIPGASTSGQADPQSLPSIPAVMGSFALVPSLAYRFPYNSTRFVRLQYVLSRNGEYEVGEISLLSKAVKTSGDIQTFVAPSVTMVQSVLLSTATLNVSLTFMSDTTTFSQTPSFGLAYKITTASPAAFPVINAATLKIISF